jgi:epoxyqueuosine reductase QueG
VVLEYGSIIAKLKSMPIIGKQMVGSVIQAKLSNRDILKTVQSPHTEITPQDLDGFQLHAQSLGIATIGYTRISPDHVFTDGTVLYDYAIVLVMPMAKDKIDTAPSVIAEKEIFDTYYNLGKAANVLTRFLKSKGYEAQAGPALGGEANYVMLAQSAGLGYCGKHGVLITPEYGPSVRIATIYTSVTNLPLCEHNPHTWIADFCKKCSACTKACPAQAIYKEPLIFDDGTEQHINYTLCAVPFSRNHGCTLCIKSCTFYKSSYDSLQKK